MKIFLQNKNKIKNILYFSYFIKNYNHKLDPFLYIHKL